MKPLDKRFKERKRTLRYFEVSDEKFTEAMKDWINRQEIIKYEKRPYGHHWWYIGEGQSRGLIKSLGYEKEGNWVGIGAGSAYSITRELYHELKELGYQAFTLKAGEGKVDLLEFRNRK